jgi:hypothetical protein
MGAVLRVVIARQVSYISHIVSDVSYINHRSPYALVCVSVLVQHLKDSRINS